MVGELGPGLRPWEIRQLTIPEVALYLDGQGSKATVPANAVMHMSHEEHLAWIAKRRAMNPMDRLEEAMAEFEEA